jgi:hypothetical protein
MQQDSEKDKSFGLALALAICCGKGIYHKDVLFKLLIAL